MKLADIANKRVLILGLGQNQGGVGAAAFFARHGARVTVTDLKTEQELKSSLEQLAQFKNIEYVLGQHRDEDIKSAELIIKNPAVPNDSPYLATARKAQIPIESDVSLFFEWCPAPIIGITGTKGKTTTTTLVSAFMNAQFPDVVTAGNLQVSVLDALDRIKPDTKVVLELSSFALESLEQHKKSPQIACMTNFFEDHLNRYGSMEEYFYAKSHIFRYQTFRDVAVLNVDSPMIRKHVIEVPSQIIWFGKTCNIGAHVCLSEGKISANGFLNFQNAEIASIEQFKLPGEHNIDNALAATAIALSAGVTKENIQQVLQTFSGVPFRIEKRGEWKGVTFINDTASTVPESTLASLTSIKQPIVLITGGSDKRLDLKKLAQGIAAQAQDHITSIVMLPGTATARVKLLIEEALQEQHKQLDITLVQTMSEAVAQAISVAKPGDAVVLSPGLTSFGLFQNEFDRGRQFNNELERIYGTK